MSHSKPILDVVLALAVAMLCGCREEPAPAACCAGDPAPVATAPAAPTLKSDSIYALDATWRDADGRPRRLEEFRGQVVVLAMIFTHCQYVCPRIVASTEALRAALPPQSAGRVAFVYVSFDTVRDQPARLAAFAVERGLDRQRTTLLVGTPADTRTLATLLDVRYERAPSGDFAHSNVLSVLDPEGRLVHQDNGLEPDQPACLAAIDGALSAGKDAE